MTLFHSPSTPRASWLWTTALLALWLAAAAALRQPWCLEPGHFLYATDALLLSASAFTCSGLSPVPIHGQFTWPGICILILLMQTGMAVTLYLSGRMALRLFPAFTSDRQPIHPAIFRNGLRVIFIFEALLVIALLIRIHGDHTSPAIAHAAFEAISAASTTGFATTNALAPGVQLTGIGQTLLIPAFLLAALGAVPIGDAWQWAASRGEHTLHPVSRRVWTSFGITFIAGTFLIAAVLLAPYSYQLLHLGMESGASDLGTVNKSVIQDALATGTYAAGPGRLGASQPIDPSQSLPSYQYIMIALSFIGIAPLSLAGGISVLGAGSLLGTGLANWRNPAPSGTTSTCATESLTRWALATLTFYVLLIALGLLILLISEPYPPMTLAAEAVAAASNSGFSLGITGDMTSTGKALITAMMLLGRIAPLYLALRFILAPPAQTR